MNSSLTTITTLWIHTGVGSNQESRLRKGLLKDYMKYTDYDPFDAPVCFIPSPRIQQHYESCDASKQHKSRKRKAPPITYNNDDFVFTSPRNQQHTDQHHVTLRPRRPPKFISCPNGTLFLVISHNNFQKILDTSRKDLENILLLQGQFCSRRLLQMSTVFTHDAREQALLQEPKAL